MLKEYKRDKNAWIEKHRNFNKAVNARVKISTAQGLWPIEGYTDNDPMLQAIYDNLTDLISQAQTAVINDKLNNLTAHEIKEKLRNYLG